MHTILFIRLKSQMTEKQVDERLREREPRFREVPGLVQKIYGRDPSTGDICGIYFFEDEQALTAFRESDLAHSIADAYAVKDVRRETYEMLFALRPERGPFAEEASDAPRGEVRSAGPAAR